MNQISCAFLRSICVALSAGPMPNPSHVGNRLTLYLHPLLAAEASVASQLMTRGTPPLQSPLRHSTECVTLIIASQHSERLGKLWLAEEIGYFLNLNNNSLP